MQLCQSADSHIQEIFINTYKYIVTRHGWKSYCQNTADRGSVATVRYISLHNKMSQYSRQGCAVVLLQSVHFTYRKTYGPTSWKCSFVWEPFKNCSWFVMLKRNRRINTCCGGSAHHSKAGNPFLILSLCSTEKPVRATCHHDETSIYQRYRR